jgi:hypothetical protein
MVQVSKKPGTLGPKPISGLKRGGKGRVVKEYRSADQVSCKPGAQHRDQHGGQERQEGGCSERNAQGD